MFEVLLLIGLFVAGVSQLLPEGVSSPTSKQQRKTRIKTRESKKSLIATSRASGVKKSGTRKNIRSGHIPIRGEQVKFSA